MSRVGKAPITVPSGVEVSISKAKVSIKGSKGSLEQDLKGGITVREDEGNLVVERSDESSESRALHGLTRSLVQNMITGVTEGFVKELQIQGVGYRAASQGDTLTLQLGFSHPVVYTLPEGISATTPTQTEVVIAGMDKQQVGQVCAEIRAFRPPEPYKGKGVRYAGEYVRRKEAKKK